jgi:hypothetical protein
LLIWSKRWWPRSFAPHDPRTSDQKTAAASGTKTS